MSDQGPLRGGSFWLDCLLFDGEQRAGDYWPDEHHFNGHADQQSVGSALTLGQSDEAVLSADSRRATPRYRPPPARIRHLRKWSIIGVEVDSRRKGSAATWGTEIFSDDLACHIRSRWHALIGDGLPADVSTERVLGEHADGLEDSNKRSVVWLALALSQWSTGRLLDSVRDVALEVIDDGSDLGRWNTEALRTAREKALARARSQLLSSEQPPNPIPKRRSSETGDMAPTGAPQESSRVLVTPDHRCRLPAPGMAEPQGSLVYSVAVSDSEPDDTAVVRSVREVSEVQEKSSDEGRRKPWARLFPIRVFSANLMSRH